MGGARPQRVLFLTGTPMENRVEEFRTLVGHLRPDVATTVKDVDGMLGGTRFRRAVAPVYLRRNQDDVLTELPPRAGDERLGAPRRRAPSRPTARRSPRATS